MRPIKRRSAISGAIDFPIVPVILAACLVLLILAAQAWQNFSFVQGFKLMPDDVFNTSAVSVSAKRMDFTLRLTPQGAAKLADYTATHPNTEIPIIFGGTSLGPLKLTPGMDTSTIHMNVDSDAGMLVRVKLGR